MASTPSFSADGIEVQIRNGDTILTALIRQGMHPTGGGCLCCAGDCPSCVVELDGVAHVRACQVAASAGQVVRRHPTGEPPALPPGVVEPPEPVAVRHEHADTVVIGGGTAGRAAAEEARSAGRSVLLYDAAAGAEVTGIYPGPDVRVRTPDGMVMAHTDEIVVATGAMELHPVCPGNHLDGIVTAGAVATLEAAGVDLGTTTTVGSELIRIEAADDGVSVGAVVIEDGNGGEARVECDTVVVDIGRVPRDVLLRMGDGLAVRGVGDVVSTGDAVPCPAAGVVCPCGPTTVDDLDVSFRAGFREIELLKRGTLSGTGVCQGGVCGPYLRSFLADRGGDLQPNFTARPVSRQMTMAEAAAGHHAHLPMKTALDGEHRLLGAYMDNVGGWWRPWTYGDTDAEHRAVRERVSVGDVSTLGKMHLTGPDALTALQRVFPTDVSTIRPGRQRYVLMLTERGTILDDGMICTEPDGEGYYLTFTSGGASVAEMWIRDWVADLDVRIMNVTTTYGAINLTGPRSREVLQRLGLDEDVPFLGHGTREIAGVPCRVLRLSFTGELSYELHHPVAQSVELWRALLEAGADFGIVPHGLEALMRSRVEKGHVVVGQDTDYDSTPRRIDHGWAVNLRKGDFLGRRAVERTNQIPLDKQLVGLVVEGERDATPFEGAVLWHGDEYAGYTTSTAWSDEVGAPIALAWLLSFDGELPSEVTVDGAIARRVELPFYDPEGARVRA